MADSTARRHGHRPLIAGFTMGPIVFFALSRIFAYLDDFERKYFTREPDETSAAEATKEELTLAQRSVWVAAFLASGRWIAEPTAAVFWNITGELRLLEIALRRRIWEQGGVPLDLTVETEIATLQDLIHAAKRRTERDVTAFWENH